MRKDMYKVIVERPRRGGGCRSEMPMPVDSEDSPCREGLRRRHRSRKHLNENLRPLERYLAAQVGRPWDKVYSEICAGIDRRNTVQQHIHQHIEDFVAVKVVRIDGVPHRVRDGWSPCPLDAEAYRVPSLYVDPDTGLLRENVEALRARRTRREAWRRGLQASRRASMPWERRELDAWTQLHCIDGVWYRVTLDLVPRSGRRDAIDRIRGIAAHLCPETRNAGATPCNLDLFGRPDVYASEKRQLPARELRAHRLVNAVR
jgi:hypothetical protein